MSSQMSILTKNEQKYGSSKQVQKIKAVVYLVKNLINVLNAI